MRASVWVCVGGEFGAKLIPFTILVANIVQILVTAPREIDNNVDLLPEGGRNLDGVREPVRALEGRDDALHPAELKEAVDDLLVRRRRVFDAAVLKHKGVLGANAGVVKTGRAGVD